jgi:uncharacterized membrane protein
MAAQNTPPDTKGPSTRTAGILLGLGLGGFVDGILLHQILQWHHLVSEVDGLGPSTLPRMRLNVLADGLFHVLTWTLVLIGILVLAEVTRSARPIRRVGLLGWMAVGWGVFNLVEGVVNHHLLQIHRVRPAAINPDAYDVGFLILGALLLLGGLAAQRTDAQRRSRAATPPDG